MNIIERGKQFVQHVWKLANRSAWDWRRCPRCGGTDTVRNGTRKVHPWTLEGRKEIRIQRHLCHSCKEKRSYSESSPLLVRGSRYGREVHRFAVDHWQHVGSSLRRTAEIVRSVLGKRERWALWRLFSVEPAEDEQCHLSHSALHLCTTAAETVGHRPGGRRFAAGLLHGATNRLPRHLQKER